MNEAKTFIAFKAITTFVKDLHEIFGKGNKSLKLYNRLVQHTTITHEAAILKHISLFENFCKENINCIHEKKLPFTNGTIVYTPGKIFIDFNYIFTKADAETQSCIWKHLLTIDAIINPTSNSKQILLADEKKEKEDSDDFIKNMMAKVESSGAENPMDLLSSGAMSEIMGGVQQQMASGNLDLGKLMGSVQTMMGSLAKEAGDDPQINQLMGMVNGLMNMAPAIMQQNAAGGVPSSSTEISASSAAHVTAPGIDMSMISQLFGSMMSGMQNKNPPSQ